MSFGKSVSKHQSTMTPMMYISYYMFTQFMGRSLLYSNVKLYNTTRGYNCYSLSLCLFLRPNRQAEMYCFISAHSIIINTRTFKDAMVFYREELTLWTQRKDLLFHTNLSTAVCQDPTPSMGLSPQPRCFGRQRSLHDILGGGIVADVILWRRRDVTIGILVGTVAAWVLFQLSGYTLLSFVSNVLLLLLSILFVWAKAAGLLNRPPPPVPKLQFSEAVIETTSNFVYSYMNMVLSASYKIALGKDANLFYRVAACLWLISLVGSLTDFLTLGYTSLVIVLTIPVLYEKYEDYVDKYVNMVYLEMRNGYESYIKCLNKVRKWILEKKENLD